MVHQAVEPKSPGGLPYALFVGDFNVGKSALLNALLHQDLLPMGRAESRALTTFLLPSYDGLLEFLTLGRNGGGAQPTTQETFRQMTRGSTEAHPFQALAVRSPDHPFTRLTLADTAGMSGTEMETCDVTELKGMESALLLVVVDIEYWSARHTLDFIAQHHAAYGDSMLIVANKADCLNLNEIRRIRDRASKRMESYGIAPAPRFLPLSARLEAGKRLPQDPYRKRVNTAVRECCDAGFDALRVALYEFEALKTRTQHATETSALLDQPLARSFVQSLEGVRP